MLQVNKSVVAGIPLIWVEPESAATRKLVIWLPGFSGAKEGVESHLHDLAAAGFVGLSFDPYQHGERRIEPLETLRERVRGNIRRYFWPILAHTAEEAPTVIDWAMQTLGVTPQVGMGGISMGGDISVAAAGVDCRIVAVTACIATADWLRPGSLQAQSATQASAAHTLMVMRIVMPSTGRSGGESHYRKRRRSCFPLPWPAGSAHRCRRDRHK